jgi:hypothetical protein
MLTETQSLQHQLFEGSILRTCINHEHITKINKKNEACFISNIIDLLVEMALWCSDLEPPETLTRRLRFPVKGSLFRPSKYKWETAADYREGPLQLQTSTFKPEHYDNPSSQPEEWTNESKEAPPVTKPVASPVSQALELSHRLGQEEYDSQEARPTGLQFNESTSHNARTSSFQPTYGNRTVTETKAGKKKRVVWYCCQCHSGPSQINYVPECLECYHMRCADCSVDITKA